MAVDAEDGGVLWRIGAAVVAPRRALASADREVNAGRAPTDLTLLLAALFAALNLETLVKGGYLVAHGEVRGGLQVAVSQIASELQWPLVCLLAGFVVITVAAGRNRRLGSDSDLACVAFVPAIVVGAVVGSLELMIGALGSAPALVANGVAIGWFAIGVALAIRQARGRAASTEATS